MIEMTVDISILGFLRFYFAILCPWSLIAHDTGYEYFSIYIGLPEISWYIGWALDTDVASIMFGPWYYHI
jgi:hypothetical protein